jgi:ABC-type branched-subunit amino acid transport system ATPase component
VRFRTVATVSDVDAFFQPGTITGLIGPNGAGKTTPLNAICGLADMSAGPIKLDGADLTHLAARDRVYHGLVRGFQTVRPMERKTPLDNVLFDANGCRNRAFCLRCSTCGRRGSAVGVTSMSFGCVELAWFARRRRSHGRGLPFATRR